MIALRRESKEDRRVCFSQGNGVQTECMGRVEIKDVFISLQKLSGASLPHL